MGSNKNDCQKNNFILLKENKLHHYETVKLNNQN